MLQSQAYEWWEQILQGASPRKAPVKIPFKGEGYDTIAGWDGVWFYSDFIPIEKGKSYWLSLDVKGPEIMAWLLGYVEKTNATYGAEAGGFQSYLGDKNGTRDPKRGFKKFIQGYDWKGQLKAGGTGQWATYSRREQPFRPTAVNPSIRFVRILLLPYWPPATYYIDNVTLREVAKEK